MLKKVTRALATVLMIVSIIMLFTSALVLYMLSQRRALEDVAAAWNLAVEALIFAIILTVLGAYIETRVRARTAGIC